MVSKPSTSDLIELLDVLNRQDLRISRVEMCKDDYDDVLKWSPCKLCGMNGIQHANPRECEIANVIDV